MEAKYALISTLVAAIVLAFLFGFLASRLKLSPIVGYLLAGLAVGPYTPGFTGNTELALQLSEIGVILLMFGVGLKISVEESGRCAGSRCPARSFTRWRPARWGSSLASSLGCRSWRA
ncbi:MAG: cation:proton antiporter [Hyphomonadaceae bacterium]